MTPARDDVAADDGGYAFADLRAAVELGVARGGHLLTEGEHYVLRRILGLRGDSAAVYARLIARKPAVFPLDDLSVPGVNAVAPALDALGGLVDTFVPWRLRAAAATRERLADGCRRLGLPTHGRRADLEQRLADRVGWDPTVWVRPRHRPLVRRLTRWSRLDAFPADHEPVLERMGTVRFADYPLTTGPALHPCRAELLRWEAAHAALVADALTWGGALAALSLRAPGKLDLRPWLQRWLIDAARALERSDPEAAVHAYGVLVDAGVPASTLAFRRARVEEALGRPASALVTLADARTLADDATRLAIERAGRRIARGLARGFPPEPPLRAARERTLWLSRADASAHRPLWAADDGPVVVEAAVVSCVRAAGRAAEHVEGALWRSLFALLFADAYFAPVAGALPVPRLSGPLDLRTPNFRRRRPLVDERLAAIAAGAAPALIRAAWETWGDVRLAGLNASLTPELLFGVADALPGPALAAVLALLCTERAGGMPDLVILPGVVTTLAAHPSRLGGGLLFAEVKGPNDALSDRQRVWHDRLLRAGVDVELWHVEDRR